MTVAGVICSSANVTCTPPSFSASVNARPTAANVVFQLIVKHLSELIKRQTVADAGAKAFAAAFDRKNAMRKRTRRFDASPA